MGEAVELFETGDMVEEGQVIKIRLGDPEAKVIEIRLSNSEIIMLKEHYLSQQKNIECLVKRKKSQRARYLYGIIFLLTNLIAWAVRDYGQIVFSDLHYVKACGIEGRSCYQKMGVLRVSLGCFIFFFIMFLATFKTSKLYEGGNVRHSEWWTLKFIVWIISLVTSLFVPSGFIQIYGEVARVGAAVFLILQLISVIEFITWWNTYWMPNEKQKQSCFLGLFMSTLFYIISMCGIGMMYSLYAPSASCSLNIFFITWTAILILVMMAMSLYSKVNRGHLSSGIMALYIVFLCWSAIRSEPTSEKCGAQRQGNIHSDLISILGFLIAICSIVMATFSTGIDSKTFQFRKNEVLVEDDIPYKYGFFHLIFSLGAMYFAMLFISWNLYSPTTKWSMDVGWASTWVKIVNEWFAATIYLWKLISPIVKQTRVANHEEEDAQQIDNLESR